MLICILKLALVHNSFASASPFHTFPNSTFSALERYTTLRDSTVVNIDSKFFMPKRNLNLAILSYIMKLFVFSAPQCKSKMVIIYIGL